MANVNLTPRDIDYISRVVATEVPASLQRTAPDQYKAMVEAVVDTITNRVASTGFPNTVEAVVNQDRQFSKIAGPRNLNPYGSVKNAPKADKSLQKMVETHLTQRANGKPSTVGNSVNYANPNYSTANNLGWINDMLSAGGRILGVGDAIHIHGNAPGAKVPDNYTLSVPGAIGNPSQMDSKVMGFSPSRNLSAPRMQPGFAQGRTFRNTDGSVFAAPSTRFSGLMTPVRPGVPTPSPRSTMGAAPTSDFRAPPPQTAAKSAVEFAPGPASRNQTPVPNPAVIQRMQDNLTNKMAFALPNPSNMNISGYGFSTPASAPLPTPPSRGQFGQARQASFSTANNAGTNTMPQSARQGRSGRSSDATRFAPGPTTSRSVQEAQNETAYLNEVRNYVRDVALGNRPYDYRDYPEFNLLPNIGVGQFQIAPQTTAMPAPSRSMTFNPTDNMATDLMFTRPAPQRSPVISTWGAMANAPTVQAPTSQTALGPTNDPSVRAAQAALAERNRRDQFARDLIKSMPAPAPAAIPSRAPAGTPGNMGAAGYGPALMDPIDIPGSARPAPVRQAVPNTQVAPSIPNVPQTVAPRTPTVTAPNVAAPMTEQQRIDKAIADMKVGIPPSDIYDQNAPGRSGFRGFGAGGFLGNLLTGNFGNMAGIEGGNRLPGLLGVIQGVVQNLGGPQQAAQAVQTVAPALGQVMGLPAAQQAAKAGNNMVIGRDAAGRIGWMADGALSAGAANAGWASNNPERFYGGYGGGYDPTPV